MASTYTSHLKLEKPEHKVVDWHTIFGNNLDTLDQAGRGNYFQATAKEVLAQYDVLAWDNSADHAVRKAILNGSSTYQPIGIAMAAAASAAEVPILTKGWVENASWSWTRGDEIYLSTTSGTLTAAPATDGYSEDGDELLMFPVGYATSATRVFFDFTLFPRWGASKIIRTGRLEVVSGTGTLTWLTGPGGGTHRLAVQRFTGNATLAFPLVLPEDFGSFLAASLWGFSVRYDSDGTDSIQAVRIHQAGGDAAVTVGAETSATFDDHQIPMSEMDNLTWLPGEEGYVEVDLVVATQLDVEVFGRVRYVPEARLLTA